ncbi:hypothetical protein [Mucilaginibacter sp. SP1R1]|uniref:hypothetical protein n=1 Tax=Mucilaginibacter sp. SP1R1 TaxID=2723091 RepID=UPI00161E9527|nr:hypothetical protein [Mucilaginibacter sp. SP1R1]MBB6151100.1 hypothetical protein [Mucilaginibacter sp. SP1R1]
MKKINYLLLLLTAGILLVTSCAKDGAVGPAGANGTAGTPGAAGATGADGTKIYSGTAAPNAALGTTGDFFINLTTSGFYGPKTAAGWGTAFNLKGATGATGASGANGTNGTNGSTILSGNTAPAASAGVDGDYYLNTVTYSFYGPKIAGTWPAPVNLKGPKGDPGTANVIYSDWFTPPTYTKTVVFGLNTLTYNLVEPKITQAILDQGVVVVYAKLNGYVPSVWPTDQVSPLPVTINYLSGTTSEIDTWSGLYSVGNVQISFKNNNNLYSSLATAHSFRYVIIPGGVKISSLNLKNYNELKSQLHIQN